MSADDTFSYTMNFWNFLDNCFWFLDRHSMTVFCFNIIAFFLRDGYWILNRNLLTMLLWYMITFLYWDRLWHRMAFLLWYCVTLLYRLWRMNLFRDIMALQIVYIMCVVKSMLQWLTLWTGWLVHFFSLW